MLSAPRQSGSMKTLSRSQARDGRRDKDYMGAPAPPYHPRAVGSCN